MYSYNLTSSFSPAPCCHQMIFPASPYIGLSFDKKGKYDENDDDPSCWEGGVKGGNMMLSDMESDKGARVCLDYTRYISVCRIYMMITINMLMWRKRRGGNMMFIWQGVWQAGWQGNELGTFHRPPTPLATKTPLKSESYLWHRRLHVNWFSGCKGGGFD